MVTLKEVHDYQYFHPAYDFIDNGAGELMLVMNAPSEGEADEKNVKFIYDGFSEAMLFRNSRQIVHLPILLEGVRDMLIQINTVLVTEMDGDNIADVYEAPIEILNADLPIPKSVYGMMFEK